MLKVTDSDQMQPADLKLLRSMRESGSISFFRISNCIVCKTEILKGTLFCSTKCHNIGKELGMTNEGKKWDEAIAQLIGHPAKVETLDGVYLEGKLTKVEAREIEINGCRVLLPVSIQMDNDQEKVVDMSRLKKITGHNAD